MKVKFPNRFRKYIKRLLGIEYLHEQNDLLARKLSQLETKLYESREGLVTVAKHRWKNSHPDESLTWGRIISGNNFIKSAKNLGLFDSGKSIIEIGPGYGRLLMAIEDEGVAFSEYVGVDISANQVQHLNAKFASDNRQFIHADAETFTTDRTFDLLISSLTFKHIFPSFKKAMQNISQFMRLGSMCFVDFIEGDKRYFEDDEKTYIRHYSKQELREIFLETGFNVLDFHVVEHEEGFSRIVVLATKV